MCELAYLCWTASFLQLANMHTQGSDQVMISLSAFEVAYGDGWGTVSLPASFFFFPPLLLLVLRRCLLCLSIIFYSFSPCFDLFVFFGFFFRAPFFFLPQGLSPFSFTFFFLSRD